jgi:hypothetical protein
MPAPISRRFTFARGALAIVAAVAFAPSPVIAQTPPGSGAEKVLAAAQVTAAPQPPAWQIAAGGKMEFEVASIHPAAPRRKLAVEWFRHEHRGRASSTGRPLCSESYLEDIYPVRL